MEALATHLGRGFVDFTHTDSDFFYEDAAGRDEALMEEFYKLMFGAAAPEMKQLPEITLQPPEMKHLLKNF